MTIKCIADLDTPALLIDRAAMDRNIATMATFFRGRRCQLRPHFKNHKCTQIARRQLAAGSAVGMTCAKLSEAEFLADAGVGDILIANQVVGAGKLERLVRLARRVRVSVAIDDLAQAAPISAAAASAAGSVGVLIEVDIGMGRCGLPPGEPVLRLAQEMVKLPGLRFEGLQAYEGHLVNIAGLEERRERTIAAFGPALQTRRLLESAGIPVRVISGGSTATYDITGQLDGIDELQAGTYVTMDSSYAPLRPEFQPALSVAARVISRPGPDVAVVDVGLKGVASEFGPPQVKGWPAAQIPSLKSEEHCVIRGAGSWKIGDVVELIPSHACTTCNLYREIHVHEEGRIVDIWPIEASGRSS